MPKQKRDAIIAWFAFVISPVLTTIGVNIVLSGDDDLGVFLVVCGIVLGFSAAYELNRLR